MNLFKTHKKGEKKREKCNMIRTQCDKRILNTFQNKAFIPPSQPHFRHFKQIVGLDF